MFNSTNPVVSYIAKLANCNGLSPIGRNMAYLRYKYNIMYSNKLNSNINKIIAAHTESNEHLSLASVVKDIIYFSTNMSYIEGFSSIMVEDILHHICTN